MAENEHVGRYGGEEFLALTIGGGASRVAELAECMRVAISGTPISGPAGPMRISASFGVAMAGMQAATDADALIAAADAALYRAKQAGRNRAEVAPFPTALQASDADG